MITVDQIGFCVAGNALLSDVSFDLRAGEVLAVVGPNGAGKSTLLKCLAGQQTPDSGRILVMGKPLGDFTAKSVARWRGVLPQAGRIPFEFLVREIVLLGRLPHLNGRESREDHRIVTEALRLTDALHLAERPVQTLSGGELQRVQMARVLAQIWQPVSDPGRLLLLDEPTSSLDLKHQHALLRIARAVAANRTAVFVILHDLNLAAAYADRILILQAGKIVACGTPRETLTEDRIESVFQIRACVMDHPVSGLPMVLTG
jgi:iron complex transport system ATP-binding protein